MIKKLKNKKLISQVIAFLLMFTLFFSNALTLKVEAVEAHDGDSVVVKMHTSATCNYTIEATYNGGIWNITSVDNGILCNGNPTNQPSFWLSLLKSYCGETGSSTAKSMVIKAIEFYVEKTGNIISSDRVADSNDHGTICYLSDGNVTWGKAATLASYKSIINKGNPGEKSRNEQKDGTHIDNPILCASVSQMDDAIKGLQVDGTPLAVMTDAAWLAIILDCDTTPSWITVTYNLEGEAVSADASGYYAKLDVPDEDQTSGNILIKLYDKTDKNVIDFKFGEIISKGRYREITYTNDSRTKVVVASEDEGYALSLKLQDGISSLSLYKTAGGSTIDAYASQIQKDNILNSKKQVECFVAIKNTALNMVDIYGGTEAKSNKAKLEKLCSVDLALLEELFGEKAFTALNGDWVFELASGNKSVVMAYKSDDPDPDANAYYYYINEFKNLRVEDNDYYDLMVPAKETKAGTKLTTQPYKRDMPFGVLKGDPSIKGNDASLLKSREALYKEILNGKTVYCSTRTIKYDQKVGTNDKPLKLGDTYRDGTEPAGEDYPPDFAINDFIILTEDVEEMIGGEDEILTEIYAKLGTDKSEIKHNFVDDVLKYGRIVIMFLFLLAVCYTAILSIQSSGDVKKRVVIKERIKDILIGMVIFAAVIPIFNLVASFLNDSYQSLGDFTGEFTGPTYNATITRFKVGYIVKFIGNVLDTFTLGINWLVDAVLSYSMRPGESTNIMQLIYTSTEDNGFVSTLLPFTDAEWDLYMMGYNLLTVMFIGLVSIGLIKIAAEFMINAGNAAKIEASKESFKRIFIAIMIVVLAPYAVRLLLTFFNYLTAMLPIDGATAEFDIDFEAAGFVGSVANLLFATVRFRIFIVFFVRKVMLALMIFSTPFICGIWAISNKFRSFNLWVGTILSNAALQFCYALVFMVVILISYKGQNPFVTLIVVVLIPRFASFFSQSLQGLGQVWGGVNQEVIADKVVSSYKGWGKKGLDKFKKTGTFLQNVSKKFDPKAISKTGRRVNNLGAIMSGNILDKETGFRTKGDTLRNRAALAENNYKKDKTAFDNAAKNRTMALTGRSGDDKLLAYDKAINDGDLNKARSLRENTAEYDIIDDYYDAKEKATLSENLYEGLYARATSIRFEDQGYLGTGQAYIKRAIDRSMYKEIDDLYDNLNSKVEHTREASKARVGSDESLAKILSKAQTAMGKKAGLGKERTPEQVNKAVDSVFNELIKYMEHAEHKEAMQIQITDAIFAGLFERKTESNGFSPEMAIKYQETKDQYFGAVNNIDFKIDQSIIAASGNSNEEKHQTADNVGVGDSMINANNDKSNAKQEQPASQQKPEKKETKSFDGTASTTAEVGEPMAGAGEKFTPGADDQVMATAGGKAFDDDFILGNNTDSGFDTSIIGSYADDNSMANNQGASEGADAKSNEMDKPATPPAKKENLNYGSIGDITAEQRIELIKHHDTSYHYDTLDDISKREELDPSKRDFDEKQLLDEERLKSITKSVQEMSAADPTQDADEVIKKAIEQVVEKEMEKEKKNQHIPSFKNVDFNQRPKR